jgi:hypothetical protein
MHGERGKKKKKKKQKNKKTSFFVSVLGMDAGMEGTEGRERGAMGRGDREGHRWPADDIKQRK